MKTCSTRICEVTTDVVKVLVPHFKTEIVVFFLTLIWFLFFSLLFATYVDFSSHHEIMGYDSDFYIGGDDPKLMLKKLLSWNLRHPLFVMINCPILLIDFLLPSSMHFAIFAFFSSLLMALSNLQIYKICKTYVDDKLSIICCVILFPSFAHIILLSGQAETYVYTIFFVLLLINLSLLNKSSEISDAFIFAMLTGTTLTNCVFFYIVKIWEYQGNFYMALKRSLESMKLFLGLFALTFAGLAYRFLFKHISLMESILNDTHKFVHDNSIPFSVIWNHYFAEPIMFHYKDQIVHTLNAEILPDYPYVIFHVVILFILILFVWGFFHSNVFLRNICLCFFIYNGIIHFLFGYGNNELQLFCGHWLFFVPIFISLGLSAIRRVYVRSFIQLSVFLCSIGLASYNGYCYVVSVWACH